MSSEIFRWCPHLLKPKYSTEYKVARSEFESPIVQKHLQYSKGIRTWEFNYKTILFESGAELKKLQDEIQNFFDARYGGYDNFWLPSFELEARAVTVSANSVTLNVDASDVGFTTTAGEYGNYFYICNRLYTLMGVTGYYDDVRPISTISGETITFATAITPSQYTGSPHVMKACKANFMNDKLTREFDHPFAWESPIEFIEDLSETYTLVLP